MNCQACRHEFCWLCMGGLDCHETPPGWGHAKQCDTMADVIAKGRVDKMYDESANVTKMERELKHLEKHSKKYKQHREMNKKHAR